MTPCGRKANVTQFTVHSNKIRKTQNEHLIFFTLWYKLAFSSKKYWSQLNHHWMANIGEEAILIFWGNLNLACSYLITTVEKKKKLSLSLTIILALKRKFYLG